MNAYARERAQQVVGYRLWPEDAPRPTSARATFSVARSRGRYAAAVMRALNAIDRVHACSDLPPLPIRFGRAEQREGYTRFLDHRFPLWIVVSVRGRTLALTALHEIGHYLDWQGFGVDGEWASRFDPRLEEWWQAVKATAAYAELDRLLNDLYAEGRISLRMASYFGSPEELWARSYAQWVAVRSGDVQLAAELDRAREYWYAEAGPYLPEQWEDDDFAPIASALDRVFAERVHLCAPVREERETLVLDFGFDEDVLAESAAA